MLTKVQAHCIKIALKTGHKTTACYIALCANIEENAHGGVFLDNAYYDVADSITRQEWRQALSVLALQGKYKASQDPEFKGHYGYVVKVSE